MFWQEEDIAPAVNSAVKVFGEQNQYHHGTAVLKNVTIMTPEYGKIWFGDVLMDETLESGFKDKMRQLSKLLNKKVCYTLYGGRFDFSDTMCESLTITSI